MHCNYLQILHWFRTILLLKNISRKQYLVKIQTENRNTKEMKIMCMKHTTRSGNTLIRCSHVNNSKWDKAYLLILKPEDCKAEYINYCPNCGGKLKEY